MKPKRKPRKAITQANCRCTRCGKRSLQWRYELAKAGGVRCDQCGGNVVQAKYA